MFVEIRKKYTKNPTPLPFVVCTAGQLSFQNAIDRPYGIKFNHLLLVTDGEGVFSVGDEVFSLSAGEGIFMRPNIAHTYKSAGDSFSTLWITFLGAESVLDYYKIPEYLRFDSSAALVSSSRALYNFCMGNSTVFTRSAEGYSWLISWLHTLFAPSAPITVRVNRFLEANFSRPLTLDEIAEAAGMSRFTLCHYYKENCNTTVIAELKKIRIAKAKEMLRHSSDSVESISQNCGFDSPSYFGKLFKSETGVSPLQWRIERRNR